jgi:hypothetical protein
VRIRGIQRDLVVNGIVFICNWLKLCKCKISLELGTEKTEKHWELAEFQDGSFCDGMLGWPNGCSGVGFGTLKAKTNTRTSVRPSQPSSTKGSIPELRRFPVFYGFFRA